MPTLEKVTDFLTENDFCLTDCGPSDGCNPDDDFKPKDVQEKFKTELGSYLFQTRQLPICIKGETIYDRIEQGCRICERNKKWCNI